MTVCFQNRFMIELFNFQENAQNRKSKKSESFMSTASIMNLNTEVKMKYKCLNNNAWWFFSKAFYDREIKLLENAKNEKNDHLPENSSNWKPS